MSQPLQLRAVHTGSEIADEVAGARSDTVLHEQYRADCPVKVLFFLH